VKNLFGEQQRPSLQEYSCGVII